MERAGAVKRTFESEQETSASRYKLTLLQKQKMMHLAENKRRRLKLLDTNRRRRVLGVAAAFDLVAATFRWALLLLTLPSAFYPERSFIQELRKYLKTNEKIFSNRYRLTVFRSSQLSSVKLPRHGRVCELGIVRGEL
jgi:hypothetical protein